MAYRQASVKGFGAEKVQIDVNKMLMVMMMVMVAIAGEYDNRFL